MKCWNVRDQTTTALKEILSRTYKEISNTEKFICKAQTIEDAKFYVEMKFRKKAFANDIEMEIIRRELNHETEKNETV